MTLFQLGFIPVTLNDLADILIVALLAYTLLRWLKGTRSVQMFFAILLLFLISLLADSLRLNGLSWIMSNIKTLGLIAFFIVFQPEIRSALIRLGGIGFADLFFKKTRALIPVDDLVDSATALSANKLGGLIVIEKKVGLRTLLESGKQINADFSPELITTLFCRHSPLHDGAVIIQGDKIAAAACVLPILQNPRIEERRFGMRHRAALGLVSESDAIVIVVSEETNHISLAHGKEFLRNLAPEQLQQELNRFLDQK